MDNLGVLLAVIGAVIVLALLVYFLRYQLRIQGVTETLVDAEEALDRGEVERARELAAPLLAKYPHLPIVQDVAADVLYANGDPLSAASLYERAMKRLGAPRVRTRASASRSAPP